MSLLSLFGFGRVTTVDDSGDAQLLQITQGATGKGYTDRIFDKIMRFGQFGVASVPPLNAGALMLHLGGDRSQTFVIATHDSPSRPKNLQPGDSALYDVRGAVIKLTADGLEIDCAGKPARIHNFSSLRVEGDLHVTGDVITRADATAVSVNGLRDAYHQHKHSGVTTGSGLSGLTDHDA
ncbi:MAG TPA: phage baseplate assembly protein [Sphingomonas sp.]